MSTFFYTEHHLTKTLGKKLCMSYSLDNVFVPNITFPWFFYYMRNYNILEKVSSNKAWTITEHGSVVFKVVCQNHWQTLTLKRLPVGVNLTLSSSGSSKNVSSEERLSLCFLWLLILSKVTSFLKISLTFLKSFRKYENFLCQN